MRIQRSTWLTVAWLALGVVFGLAFLPTVGLRRAAFVPVGWYVGGILGCIGGAVFTSYKPQESLKRTLSATVGAVALAAMVGAGWMSELSAAEDGRTRCLKAMLVLAGVIVISPASVAVAFKLFESEEDTL